MEDATEATACATKAHKAFDDWKTLITALRQAILDKQNAVPSQPSLPTPTIPNLPAPPEAISTLVSRASASDPVWAELPDIEALYRRFYGFLAYGAGGISYPAVGTTQLGREYLADMRSKLQAHDLKLDRTLPTTIAKTCDIAIIVQDLAVFVTQALDKPAGWTSAILEKVIPYRWATVHGVLRQAKFLGFIPNTSNTWDITDIVDAEYYVCSSAPSALSFSPTYHFGEYINFSD